ncbi:MULTISPECIES: NAD(P)-dependent alcohol dehydrogenase [Micromonospora]|uniref:NAD(P)-dependent alcohol dehydrogenase n=1 Tax=Micromonospora solifontis TaxID=2487138 RepID=A0ABX9WL28_9ACTN|nr:MULTISPECIES: NAD(P)-dependent alcohol dehydrogenase [Micromonospora]NES14899.1 NAD(P)-dependent alcohol dehydrogenase [Micromonospora sp. PPF5-17B]NES35178.1 NAD(P)-dependent alcohol dehydrogenase [Micromonospora solifontis]NES55173.1 NAD(P)-dependent alcohol dehydrogenase [Micromonospora sp. PPF5-6]RNM01159.1 NAD(P)-dependent alcohol dehydrogenase [Micromonospora solifontis]
MKAIVQDRYGPPETLTLADVAAPVPGANEVLVRIEAAALNAYDWHAMRGDPRLARLAMGRSRPRVRIRGRDFAGRVEAVGADVRQVRPGDAVFGDLGEANGAFAEYACVPETSVAPKPANLTPQQAAALPLAGITALMGLRDVGRVEPGHRVLINGASGGVGTLAVQLAKALGASVTAVCSTRNVDLVRSLGADHVVDYTREDFTRDPRRHDVLFDLVGNRSLTALRRALTSTGTLVLSGGGVYRGGSLVGPVWLIARGRLLAPFVRHRIVTLAAAPSREHLDTLRTHVEAGRLAPVIDRTYPLHEVPQAIRYLESEHARAKVVITV